MMDGDLVLLFRAGSGTLAALPARHVIETMRPLALEPLAGGPELVSGAAILRGRAAPVVDAAALLGLLPGDAVRRWVALDVAGRVVALAVNEVIGLRRLPSASSGPAMPPLLATASRAAVEAISVLDGELLVVLETARIVPDEVWRELEGRRDDVMEARGEG